MSTTCFLIEDEFHAEHISVHDSLADATRELRRLAEIPWDQKPNRPPCTSWRTCHRSYEVIEYDTTSRPWEERQRLPALNVSSLKVEWEAGFAAD